MFERNEIFHPVLSHLLSSAHSVARGKHQWNKISFLLCTICFLRVLFHFTYQTQKPSIDPTET